MTPPDLPASPPDAFGRSSEFDTRAVPVLTAAPRAVGSGSRLDATLHDIVQAAVQHVDAAYGVMGVLTPDGRELDRFVVVGLGDEERHRIGRPPEGHEILGLLMVRPVALRPDDLNRHPGSQELPAADPPMRSFVGVPVRVGDSVFGNLYLTEKRTGGLFTEADVGIAQTLAGVAGLAIENARLAEQAEIRRRWGQAATEMSTALLSGADPDDVLRAASDGVSALTHADLVGVLWPSRDGQQSMSVVAAVGETASDVEGVRIPLDGNPFAVAHEAGEPRVIEDISRTPVLGTGTAVDALTAGYGPALVLPLGTGTNHGLLVILRAAGSPPFDRDELDLLTSFAAHASAVLEVAHAQQRAHRAQVQADRERIARDLHDHIVQRIFATALSLDRLGRSLEQDRRDVAAALSQRVDELHGTIERIRTSIFELHEGRDASTAALRSRLAGVLRSATEGHGLRPDLRIRCAHDDLPPDLVLDLVAVVRELVTNVVRHAGAKRVTVAVDVRESARVVVTDDGSGMPPVTVRSGLANLGDRAERRGGFMSCISSHSGTEIRWSAPVPS